jgi:hypothetical protein
MLNIGRSKDVKQPRSRQPAMSYIGVRIPRALLDEIDAEARENSCSMSKVIRGLLQFALNGKHREK